MRCSISVPWGTAQQTDAGSSRDMLPGTFLQGREAGHRRLLSDEPLLVIWLLLWNRKAVSSESESADLCEG